MKRLSEGAWSVRGEQLLGLAAAVGQREFEAFGDELLDVWSLDVVGLGEFDNLEDVDAPKSGTVAGSHILVQSLDGLGAAHLSVLLVHVVGAGPGIVTDPDTEVLDLQRAFLVDDVDSDNLSVRLLDLAQLHQKVPEARLGDHGVGCEDAHAVQLRGRVRVGGQVTPDHLVFLKTTHLDLYLTD